MAQYINKDALVAEIEKKLADILACKKDASTPEERIALTNMLRLCKGFLSFIDTLEVKEVDLEKEVNIWRHNHFHGRRDKDASGEYLERISQLDLAKYFFELGLKAQKG